MVKMITKNQEILVSESGIQYNCSTQQHSNKFGVILENIGCMDTMLDAIMYETPMEQEEAGQVVGLIIDLLGSGAIYNIEDFGGYFVRPEVAKMLKRHLGINTFIGMTNDESAAMWNCEEEVVNY
jgi:hypothetical protein